MRVHKLIATGLGIGYMGKGGGTVAAIATCAVWYVAQAGFSSVLTVQQIVVSLVLFVLGVWSGNKVEPEWGKDDKKVVIDEVAGMCISLIGLPVTAGYVLAGLVLFRFFDIAKPLYIRRAERFSGGMGVMMDDVLAGVYSNILLQLFFHLQPFNGL